MKIIQDGVHVASFPWFRLDRGVMYLHGIDFQDRPTAIYRPLLKIWRGGVLYIETPLRLIVLSRQRPYIQILKSIWEQNETNM